MTRTHSALALAAATITRRDTKNSWGSGWGEEGYFRLARGTGREEGTCGIYRKTVYPVPA
jgi:hypothetical protein